MLRREVLFWGLALLALLYAATSLAGTDDDYGFKLRGFGTMGAVYHDTPGGVTYRRDISQSVAAAAKAGHISFAQDSMLGVQGSKTFGTGFEASLQMVSRLDAWDTFYPQVTMGYLKYRSGDSFVRAGRMTIETYLKGDAAEVGYANVLVRQPIMIYPRTFDGLDAETTVRAGDGLVRFKAMAGHTLGYIANTTSNYNTTGSTGTGAFAEYTRSGWTLRGAVYLLKMKDELADLQPGGTLDTLLAGAPNAGEIFARLTMKGRRITSQILALEYDHEAIQSEIGYSQIRSHDWPLNRLFRASFGYRVGRATPYISYASSRYARHYASAYPAGVSPQTDQLNEALMQAQAGMLPNETDQAIGVRYDFARNMALKFQYDHFRYQDPGSIVDLGLSNVAVETRGYRTLGLYSVVLDFVF